MTEPDERLPRAGAAQPSSEHDPERAEEYAESVAIDPSPDEIATYLELVGDPDGGAPVAPSAPPATDLHAPRDGDQQGGPDRGPA